MFDLTPISLMKGLNTLLVRDQYKAGTGSLLVMSPSMLHKSKSWILPLEQAKRQRAWKNINENQVSLWNISKY